MGHYSFIRELIQINTGIIIDEDKDYLIEFRLTPLAKEYGFSSLRDFINSLPKNLTEICTYKKQIIESLTTTETYFFRDMPYFDIIRNLLIPEIIEKNLNSRTIRIWSSVCSTGQEAYSIRFIFNNYFSDLNGWNIEIYASDINTKALDQAKKGEYNELEMCRGLPDEFRNKYFLLTKGKYIVKPDYYTKIQFFEINLIDNKFNLPEMDIILLRNVLIYFNEESKKNTIEKMKNLLKQSGYLILGSTEHLKDYEKDFERIRLNNITFYKKV